jgi:hypothetical protein
MFSDEDLELVTRNIEEILRFHEIFVDELRTALIPLGFSMSNDGSEIGEMLHMKQKKDIKSPDPPLEAAIAVVSTIFTHKVSCMKVAFGSDLLTYLRRLPVSICMRISAPVTRKPMIWFEKCSRHTLWNGMPSNNGRVSWLLTCEVLSVIPRLWKEVQRRQH